jgi:hypothetical protein
MRVDLPTLGLPIMETNPALCDSVLKGMNFGKNPLGTMIYGIKIGVIKPCG